MRKREKGFTLIEILTASCIASLIALLAIPNFLRVWQDVNERTAQETLRTIHQAMISYRGFNLSYPSTLSELADSESGPHYLNQSVAGGKKSGYLYRLDSSDRYTFRVSAIPENPGVSGNGTFVVTEAGVIQKITIAAPTVFPNVSTIGFLEK